MDSLLSVETLSNTGLDFLFIDMEHGVVNVELLHHMAALLLRGKTLPVGRVAGDDAWQLKRALDTGIRGVIVPFVNTAEQAAEAVRHAKYPPDGSRGAGCMLAAARWGITVPQYMEAANDQIAVIAQIETAQAVENAEAIARTPGIDMLFVGPADLSSDLGVPSKTSHPLVEDCVARVVTAAERTGVALGTVARTPEEIHKRTSQGFSFLVITGDVGCLARGAATALDQARRATAPRLDHDSGQAVRSPAETGGPRS